MIAFRITATFIFRRRGILGAENPFDGIFALAYRQLHLKGWMPPRLRCNKNRLLGFEQRLVLVPVARVRSSSASSLRVKLASFSQNRQKKGIVNKKRKFLGPSRAVWNCLAAARIGLFFFCFYRIPAVMAVARIANNDPTLTEFEPSGISHYSRARFLSHGHVCATHYGLNRWHSDSQPLWTKHQMCARSKTTKYNFLIKIIT